MPDGNVGFVEVKTPGKVPRAIQISVHKRLKRLGFKVFGLEDIESITYVIDEIRGGDDL